MKIYQALAQTFQAYLNCEKTGNTEWESRHQERIESLVKEYMPSGAGFNSGTTFDFESHSSDRLVFNTSYHHMDDNGCYDGWTHHSVIITPSLAFGFNIRVTGRDRNDIKDYIAEVFHDSLTEEIQ